MILLLVSQLVIVIIMIGFGNTDGNRESLAPDFLFVSVLSGLFLFLFFSWPAVSTGIAIQIF